MENSLRRDPIKISFSLKLDQNDPVISFTHSFLFHLCEENIVLL